jgi:putative membrane protein
MPVIRRSNATWQIRQARRSPAEAVLPVDVCARRQDSSAMMSVLISWLVLSAAFWVTAKILPGFQLRGGAEGALVVAAVFGIINWLIGWLLFVVLGIASLGIGFLLAFLTRWLVNAILLMITDSVSSRLDIDRFRTALVAALLISFFGTAGQWLVRSILG